MEKVYDKCCGIDVHKKLIDDLNGIMTPLQRRMMKELLAHLDELNVHIQHLNDEIDNFMKPEEKKASSAIQDVTGIVHNSAQAIISVIGTDMDRFPTDAHISSWAGLCPGNNESAGKRKSGRMAWVWPQEQTRRRIQRLCRTGFPSMKFLYESACKTGNFFLS